MSTKDQARIFEPFERAIAYIGYGSCASSSMRPAAKSS
jgi:hypothetical protein